jgi:hypothetical protein
LSRHFLTKNPVSGCLSLDEDAEICKNEGGETVCA